MRRQSANSVLFAAVFSLLNILLIRSIIFTRSTFSRITVTIMVKVTDSTIVASGLSHSERAVLVQAPRKAPMMVIDILPRKKAAKNFVILYFNKPSGITTGSSGMGVAAAM